MNWRQRRIMNARLTALDREGKRLEMLHEYTKWHNGIYLSIGGGLTVLATNDQTGWPVTVNRGWALGALILMAVAGMAGGIIATNAMERRDLGDFMASRIGAFQCAMFTGRVWTHIEHYAFWSSLCLLVIAMCKGEQNQGYVVAAIPSRERSSIVGLCSHKSAEAVKYWDTERQRVVITRGPLLWWKPPSHQKNGPSQASCASACKHPHASYAFVCAQPIVVEVERAL